MHTKIDKVFDLMDAYGEEFEFRLLTNGTRLDETMLRRLETLKIRFVQVSLDGDEARHDALRGKGNFRAVVQALDRLHEHAIPTVVSFTAHAGNYTAVSAVAQVCREHHVGTLWSDRYIPCDDRAGLQTLSPQQTREYVRLLQEEREDPANRQAKLRLFNRRSLQFLSSGEYPYHCTAGQNALAIDDKGRVYPCRRLAVVCGNVFDTSLTDLYASSPVLEELRNAPVAQECASCRHRAFCRGGSRCLAFALRGCMVAKDPGCWL